MLGRHFKETHLLSFYIRVKEQIKGNKNQSRIVKSCQKLCRSYYVMLSNIVKWIDSLEAYALFNSSVFVRYLL